MVTPDPAEDPVIPPVITPIVQLKLLGVLDAKDMPVEAPLHIVDVAEVVITGIGFTVTVTVKALPAHKPPVDVGVIIYSTEPAVALLGSVSA